MSEQIQDDFISVLQGNKISGMDPKWRVIARMVRNIMIKEDNLEEQLMEKRQQAFEKRIGKVLQDRYLIPKQKRTFAYKNWILGLLVGISTVYATKEYVHFVKPLPIELTLTLEQSADELEGQDPKLFWKKWFNNGTFILFGSRRIVEPLKTNIVGCNPEAMSFKSCSELLKTHPYNANLLFNLGLMYENGFDVDQNYSKAIEFYKRSAALGNHFSLLNYEYLINQDLTK
jgi:TPR repeat protein